MDKINDFIDLVLFNNVSKLFVMSGDQNVDNVPILGMVTRTHLAKVNAKNPCVNAFLASET